MKKTYQYIVEKTATGKMDKQIAVDLIKLLKQETPQPAADEIAIIGMATLFPQANDTVEFWEKLRGGVDCVAPLPGCPA